MNKERDDALAEVRKELEAAEAAFDDEEAAHQDTLRLLAEVQRELVKERDCLTLANAKVEERSRGRRVKPFATSEF